MAIVITPIDMISSKAYLLAEGDSFFLIDCGMGSGRKRLSSALATAGCLPGKLKLVILTHGDSDHVENAPWLREEYGARIAIHSGDLAMVEKGNMGEGRKEKPDRVAPLFRIIMFLGAPSTFQGFKPDIILADGDSFADQGLSATVLHLPGHSRGSIAVLTLGGDLFLGDLLKNLGRPSYHWMISDMADARASVDKALASGAVRAWPGHGKSFTMNELRSMQKS